MSDHLPLAGKTGVIFGVANKRSIAWAIAQAWAKAGAKLIFNYQGERRKENVEELVGTFGPETPRYPCDVSSDTGIDNFFAARSASTPTASTSSCTASPSPRARPSRPTSTSSTPAAKPSAWRTTSAPTRSSA